MKKILLAGTILAGLGAPALAADSALTLWNDANPGGAVTATGTGSAVISGSSLGGITISTSGVIRGVVPGPNMTESNLFITNTSGVVQTLDIIAGTNGFLGPDNLFNASATILVGAGPTAQLFGEFYVSTTNALNGVNTGPIVGTQLGGTFDSGVLTGPFSFSFNSADVPFSVSGSFGMAEALQLVLQPGAFVGVQSISMDAANAVPELSTWAYSLSGFGLLALVALKRRKTALYASL